MLGDGLRLRQVLINLANNAIKFCSGPLRTGQVSVRAVVVEHSTEHVNVEFQIIDNGIGMDEETRGRLFTAFSQPTPPPPGTLAAPVSDWRSHATSPARTGAIFS